MKFGEIADIVITSDGVACGEELSISAYRENGRLYFRFRAKACSISARMASYLERMLSGCEENFIFRETQRLLAHQFLNEERWMERLLPKRRMCLIAPVEVLQSMLKKERTPACDQSSDKQFLACDACVRVRTLNWSERGNRDAPQSFKNLISSLKRLDNSDELEIQRLGLCVLNDHTLVRQRFALFHPEEIAIIHELRLAAPFYNNAQRCHVPLDPRVRGLALRQQISVLVAKREITIIEDYIESQNLNIGVVKGGRTAQFYPDGDIRPHMDFDYLAPKIGDACKLISYLMNERKFRLVAGGSVPFSLKCVLNEADEEVLTGHIHLEKILQNRYQVVVDINMGGFPLGRTGVIQIEDARKIELEDIICITLSHLFKHGNVFVKDINDLYYILGSGQFDKMKLERKIRKYRLSNYWNIVIRFMVKKMKLKAGFHSRISLLAALIGRQRWPFSRKSHFYVKLADMLYQGCRQYGLIKGVQEAWRQLTGCRGRLPTRRYAMLVDELNSRVYLYPVTFFSCYRVLPEIEEVSVLCEEIRIYKHVLILPIGLFAIQDSICSREELNSEIRWLLGAYGITEVDCNESYVMDARRDLWLY